MELSYVPTVSETATQQLKKAEEVKAKFDEYLKTLELQGLIRRTRSGMGYSRNISKRTYEEFLEDVPVMEDVNEVVYKCTYEVVTETDEDDADRYLLVIMDYASPINAVPALMSAGLPSPKQLKAQIEEASSLFDY